MQEPTYSFVIPVYNEAEVFPELRRRMTALLDSLDAPGEVVLVDDGSRDGSYEAMVELHRADPRFKVVQFSRNFGHQIAVTAGLDHAQGRAVVILDADLQDPPELIPEMIRRWREGYDVVYAVRRRREGENAFKKATAAVFYRALRRLTGIDVPLNTGDFRLVDRAVVDAITAMPEGGRFLRGMFAWAGFRQIGVAFDRPQRHAGKTKYPLGKMIRLATDGLLSFSSLPLKMALHVGWIVAAVSFLYGLVAIITRLGPFAAAPGWASLVVLVTFLGGVQLMALGVLGQYLARVFDEVRHRPLYLVRRTHGLSEDAQGRPPSPTRPKS